MARNVIGEQFQGDPSILISSLDWMVENVDRCQPDYMISILDNANELETSPPVSPCNHLKLDCRDFPEWQRKVVRGAHVPSVAKAITKLLRFGDEWDGRGRVLIHCEMGLSRSPAAALILACQKRQNDMTAMALALRARSPFISPNRMIIDVADDLMRCQGRLKAAREKMGKPRLGKPDFPLALSVSYDR